MSVPIASDYVVRRSSVDQKAGMVISPKDGSSQPFFFSFDDLDRALVSGFGAPSPGTSNVVAPGELCDLVWSVVGRRLARAPALALSTHDRSTKPRKKKTTARPSSSAQSAIVEATPTDDCSFSSRPPCSRAVCELQRLFVPSLVRA